MSAVVETRPPVDSGAAPDRFARVRSIPELGPIVLAVANALAFYVVRPNVGDLQAALARQSAASNGVGLTYWFNWFGGGATPGNYSVVSPWLSSLIGAPLIGALATIAITPLAYRALAGTANRMPATWVATVCAGFNLWSGRIPFALGCAVALIALIGVRERRPAVAVAAIVASSLCSPVTGAFLSLALGAAFLVEPAYRRLIFWACAACGVTLLVIAIVFGNPGSQGYSIGSALLTAGCALVMILAKPAAALRVALWCTVVIAPVLTTFPNGLGSNFARFPAVCLPAAVLATATVSRRMRIVALLPALALCGGATTFDLVRSGQPSASVSYYRSLITDLNGLPDLANYRLEVVQNPLIHTAAYALIGHVALAGGYETQEQNELNGILKDASRLNAISYKVWLENNAVGYVAFNKGDNGGDLAEYHFLAKTPPKYLVKIRDGAHWILYRVQSPTPIVPAPATLVSAKQAALTIKVPCVCTFGVRVRFSKFLSAATADDKHIAEIVDDGSGWTRMTIPAPGTYVLS